MYRSGCKHTPTHLVPTGISCNVLWIASSCLQSSLCAEKEWTGRSDELYWGSPGGGETDPGTQLPLKERLCLQGWGTCMHLCFLGKEGKGTCTSPTAPGLGEKTEILFPVSREREKKKIHQANYLRLNSHTLAGHTTRQRFICSVGPGS